MMRAAAIFNAAALALVAATATAVGEETTFDKSVLPKLFEELDRRATPNDYFQQRPVDIWRKATGIADSIFPASTVDYDQCAKDVLACPNYVSTDAAAMPASKRPG